MAPPTDANVDFLVCDEARQEPDGKINLLGLYPSREIRLNPEAQLPVGLNLGFVFVLRDGDGEFSASFRIADPLGKELLNHALPDFKKTAGQGHALSLNVRAIPVLTLGNYTAELCAGDLRFCRTIRVMQ
jgi:hypothetical protein